MAEQSKEAKAFRKDLERMVWAGKHPSYKKTIDGKRYIEIHRKGQGFSWEPIASISTDDLITVLPGSATQADFNARKPRSHASKRDRGVIGVMPGGPDRRGDPLGPDKNGVFRWRMVPSGDIVGEAELHRRLPPVPYRRRQKLRSHLSKPAAISNAKAAEMRAVNERRLARLRANGEDKRKTSAWRDAVYESSWIESEIARSRRSSRTGRSHASKRGHNKAEPYRLGEWTVTDSDAMRMERAGRTSEPFKLSPERGRTLFDASEAGDSYQVETLDGKHRLYMPGSRGIAETLRNVRKHWKSRIGQRVRIYRVLPGSRTGAMLLEEAGERTL